MPIHKLPLAAVLTGAMLAVHGCVTQNAPAAPPAPAAAPVVVVAPPAPVAPAAVPESAAPAVDRPPIIAVLDYSPKTAVGKADVITFTVVANDPEGQPLQYTWTATKGHLTGNTGQVAGWRPAKADGTFEKGLTTVHLIVSDGRQTTAAAVNIMIDEQGQAKVDPTPAPPPAPVPTPVPTSPVPTSPPQEDTESLGRVIFHDGFEPPDAPFTPWDPANPYGGLSWKVTSDGAQGTGHAAIVNNAEDAVPASITSGNMITARPLFDLSTAKNPRLRFYVKNPASPPEAVSFRAVWRPETGDAIEVAENFTGSLEWSHKDVNLVGVKGIPGRLSIEVYHTAGNTRYGGPLVDSITLYDAP
jgi:hypothetical protein